MNILFISGSSNGDYMQDMVLHGLKSLFGDTVVDYPRVWSAYADSFTSGKHQLTDVYGKGFTLYGLLGDDSHVDRTDILKKIQNKYFDLIVFGSIWRGQEDLYYVMGHYPVHKIIFIDGEDGPQYYRDLVHQGLYFKRELHNPQVKVFPIQFAIPEEKIQNPVEKQYMMAPLDPMNPATYIYNDEASYYRSYSESMFATTMKKAGWDCLRHYEIMANRCIPHFRNLEDCPQTIMQSLPKEELMVAKTMLEYSGENLFYSSAGKYIWEVLMDKIIKKLKSDLTTVALAKYVIDTSRAVGDVCAGFSSVA